MRLHRCLVSAILLMLIIVAGKAETITCRFKGSGSGAIGARTFTNVAFTITTVGNTINRKPLGTHGYLIDNASASISVSGVGEFTLSVPTYTFVAYNGSTTSFGFGAGRDLVTGYYSGFHSCSMLATLNPITLSGSIQQWTRSPAVVTSGGTAVLYDGTASVVFEAMVSSGPSLVIETPPTLPNAMVNAKYEGAALIAGGGLPPYSWSLASGSLPPGLSLLATGVITGMPTVGGTFSFTARVTDGANVATERAFTLTVGSSSNATRSGAFAHLATGGGWSTAITLVNRSASAVNATVTLRAYDGRLLSLPLTVSQQGLKQVTVGSSINAVINPNATLLIAMEDQLSSTLVGWADVVSSVPLSGFAIFRSTPGSGTPSEGTVPLQSEFLPAMTISYDNSSGFVTGVAIANLSAAPADINATIWDDGGNQLGTRTISMLANGHTAFALPDQLPATAGKRGIVRFQSAGAGNIAGLGLRFSPFGTFTSVPPL